MFTIVLVGALSVVATLVFIAPRMQRQMLFPCPRAPEFDPATLSPDAERWLLDLKDGSGSVEAWFFPPPEIANGPRPLIIFAHGNGELIDDWGAEFLGIRRWGLGVLLVEYPGYGRSGGAPTEDSITETMISAYDRAAGLGSIDATKIIGYGRSLGGGAIGRLSLHRELVAIIFESTFTSVVEMAKALRLPSTLVQDRFDNLEAVKAFGGPVLVVHGDRDDLIPPAHARQLAEASSRSTLVMLSGGHNDCPRPWRQVADFLEAQGLAL